MTPGVIFKGTAIGGSEGLLAALLAASSAVPLFVAACALAASLGGTLAALYLGRRRAGGSVRSSEADELWQEGTALREFLHKRVGELQAQVDSLTQRVDTLAQTNDALRIQLEASVRAATYLEARIALLHSVLDDHLIPYPPEV